MAKSISVIGGDLRHKILAKLLQKSGYEVKAYGFDTDDDQSLVMCESVADAVEADFIVLPLPVSYDNEIVNAPLSNDKILIKDVLEKAPKNAVILGGRISEYLQGELEVFGLQYSDYFLREELTIHNAIPTAEGAIEIALSEMPITLHGSKCLVLGFGRIGKVLAKMLHGIGADVTVEARKCEDLAWIHTLGYKGMNICELNEKINKYDIIFNTIPSVILDKQVLRNIKKKSLVIDLASKPGGVDFNAAKEIGVRVIWALSLPGKVAPVTSGEIIKDTIINIINEMGGI